MVQSCGDLDLTQEALGSEDGRQLGVHHLERDQPVVAHVARQIDRGHAALAEFALDLVAAGERGLELVQAVCHRVERCAYWNAGATGAGLSELCAVSENPSAIGRECFMAPSSSGAL